MIKLTIILQLIFGLCIGLVSGGGHHIRLVILLALGLAGMWMMHMLAQDFNKISGAFTNASKGVQLFRSKRHNDYYNVTSSDDIEINWAKILARDPTGCARSFVCQLAVDNDSRAADETAILRTVELTTTKENEANKQMRTALRLGRRLKSPRSCYKRYRLCPYSGATMMSLLRLFGGVK